MTLAQLRTYLTAAASGTDFQEVFFDYNKAASKVQTKSYPLVLWDFVGIEGVKSIRAKDVKDPLEMYVWAVKKFVPDTDKILEWDSLVADLDEYLLAVDSLNDYLGVGLINIPWGPYPPGFFSADREISIRYRVTLTLWC